MSAGALRDQEGCRDVGDVEGVPDVRPPLRVRPLPGADDARDRRHDSHLAKHGERVYKTLFDTF